MRPLTQLLGRKTLSDIMIADADGQFIFKENEFEDESFVAAAFVAKYRKVSSLESLKDQLMQYSNALKQQLYNIINRDYKDFITISTKLDGVDTRTLLLQKPLLELKGDLSALHEGVVTGMQAIQEKVKHRLEVSGRRELVQAVLLCMERLDATDAILLSSIRVGAADGGEAEGGLGDLLGPAKGGQPAALAPAEPQRSSQRSRLLRAMDRKIAAAGAPAPGAPGRGASGPADRQQAGVVSALLLERDVFVCSELERASFCLAAVDAALADLWRQYVRMERVGDSNGEGGSEESKEESSGSGASMLTLLRSRPGLLSLYRTLEAQAAAHKATLVSRVHSQLTHLLTNAVGGAAVAGAETGEAQSSQRGGSTSSSSSRTASKSAADLRSRSVAHCLRALCTLRSAQVAEELVRSAVVGPLARSCLTAGRVDGKGGRGSYAGLEDALQSILDAVAQAGVSSAPTAGSSGAPSFLLTCLRVGEEVRSYCHDQQPDGASLPSPAAAAASESHTLDLMAHGVWQPVAELVQERFSEMFSVGIPSTLSHCYRCMRQFLQKLQTICGASFAAGIAERLDAHPLVAGFFAQWKLDLYFQLRCKEVFGRLDRMCDGSLRQGPVAPQGLLNDLYFKQEPAGSTSLFATTSPHQAVRDDVEKQLAACGGLQVPAFRAAALELRASLHPAMLLDPLAGKFLTLLLRILMRAEAHVAVSANVTTPSFASMAELEQMRELCSAAQAEPRATPAAASATPAGKRSGGGAAATPAGTGPGAAASSTPGGGAEGPTFAIHALAMDELVLLCADLACLEAWLPGEFSTAAASALVLRRQPFWKAGAVDLRAVDAVRSALSSQVGKLRGARAEVWAKVGALLGAECKKALGAVKSAVVSKYRMTNKPAPESPSAYVETILAPFRNFMAQFSGVLGRLTGAAAASAGQQSEAVRRWQSALLEDVSASFGEQVSALIETVRQMDSTLQRRSKAQASAPAASANMSDSEKIALQIRLDIEAYGREISAFGLDLASMPAYISLRDLRFEQA